VKETENHVRASLTIYNTPSQNFVDTIMENRRLTAPKINMQSIRIAKNEEPCMGISCVFT
jgi:hypothetical protein